MKYVLSYGGGINSSALFFFLIERKLPLDIVVFADTGNEMQHTYDAVERMEKRCDRLGIQFVTVRSDKGKLYDYYMQKRAVPSFMKRDCTGKFKVAPIRKFLRITYGKDEKFGMYIGISSEEWSRMRDSNVKYIKNIYPFCDYKIDREENKRILSENFFVASKSGCTGCVYNKRKEWLRMSIEEPDEFSKWELLDKNNSRYPEVTLSPNCKLEDIRKMNAGQLSLIKFEEVEPSCEVSGSCFL